MTKNQLVHVTDPVIQQQEAHLRDSDPDLLSEAIVHEAPALGAVVVEQEHALDTQESQSSQDRPKCPFRFVPLKMGGGGRTHVPSVDSARLILEEVSLEDLKNMTERFYDKAFQDDTLDKFIRSHDDPHGPRFAKWIHSKLSGSTVWEEDRASRSHEPVMVAGGRMAVVHDRTSAHAAAWYSPKRAPRDVGRHFELDECRVWMRLHFWALRESGLLERSPSFADYYIRFIAHFVRVYESRAPMFVRESFRWSQDPANIDRYLKDGRKMNDVLSLDYEEALQQLPESESHDYQWPYLRSNKEWEGQALYA